MLAQVIDPICIKHNNILLGQISHQRGKESCHIGIPAQAWPHYPDIDRLAPRHDLLHPQLWHMPPALRQQARLLVRHEHRMDDDLRGVGFDGSGGGLVAEYVAQVAAHFQGGDGRVEGGARELVTAPDDADSPVLAFAVVRGEDGQGFYQGFHDCLRAHGLPLLAFGNGRSL